MHSVCQNYVAIYTNYSADAHIKVNYIMTLMPGNYSEYCCSIVANLRLNLLSENVQKRLG